MSVDSISLVMETEIDKGERSVRDGPNEFKGRMEVGGEFDEIISSAWVQETVPM